MVEGNRASFDYGAIFGKKNFVIRNLSGDEIGMRHFLGHSNKEFATF